MKKIHLEKIINQPKLTGDTRQIVDFCSYLLTLLCNEKKQKTLYGYWNKQKSCASFCLADDSGVLFKEPTGFLEIVKINDVSIFRSILARLGNYLVDETYLGAGTFEVEIKPEKVVCEHFAIIFSNNKDTGYWIKLQRVE